MSNTGVDITTYAANSIADATALGLLLFLAAKDKPTIEAAHRSMHTMLANLLNDERVPDDLKTHIRTRLHSICEIALQQCK